MKDIFFKDFQDIKKFNMLINGVSEINAGYVKAGDILYLFGPHFLRVVVIYIKFEMFIGQKDGKIN